jgi:hypothetical protein
MKTYTRSWMNVNFCFSQKLTLQKKVRFHVFTETSVKMADFFAPCSLVDINRRFRSSCSPHHQGDESRLYIPEDSHLHTGHRENLQSYQCGA